ncbi:thiol peroxidase [Elusimicrobiota bacterium]
MKEKKGIITMKGSPLTLLGDEIKVGDKAPGFTVLDNSLSEVSVSSFKDKIKVIVAVPSLDTPVCDIEAKRFNKEAGQLGSDTVVLTISMDLPFAQKRWCAAGGADSIKVLSDYRDASFANAYGVLIKELRLLARAVFIIDREGIVRYASIVKEVTSEPDYSEVLEEVKKLHAKV